MGAKVTRIAKWDNFKLFLIICVVIGHAVKPELEVSRSAREAYWFIYLFHMPAFVLVSGMFAKRSIREKRYDRAFMFLLLFFLIKFLVFFVRLLLGERISISLFTASGTEWYAFALFVYYLLTMFLQQFDKKYIMTAVLILGCVAGYDTSLGDYLVLARLFTFFPFFFAGYCLSSESVLAFTGKRVVKVLAVLLIVAAVLVSILHVDDVFWTVDLLKGNTSYRIIERDIRIYGGLMRLGQYIISTALVFALFALIPARRFPFTWMGRSTLPVYALHYALIELFNGGMKGTELLKKLCPDYYVILLVIMSVLLVCILSTKPFVLLVNRLIVPKKAGSTEDKSV